MKLQVQPPESVNGRPKLVISVRDTGIGIQDNLRAAVFAPFRQADTSHTRSHAGTGLGLAICHQLAIRMKGRLGIWSSQGPEDRGTEISLLLPFEGGLQGEAAVLGPSGSRIINEAPTIFETPLTERKMENRPHSNSGPRVGLALRQDELESIFSKAFLEAGLDIVTLGQQDALGVVTEVDHLWIDLENVRRVIDKTGPAELSSKTTLFLLCDNVHATAQDPQFQDLFASVSNDIVCMPRPAVIQDVLHCLSNPDAADSCGGHRVKASERTPKLNGHATGKLHLDGIGKDETKFDVKALDAGASGPQSPPLVGFTETQSMVAALLPAKATKPTVTAPTPGSVVLLVDDNIVSNEIVLCDPNSAERVRPSV